MSQKHKISIEEALRKVEGNGRYLAAHTLILGACYITYTFYPMFMSYMLAFPSSLECIDSNQNIYVNCTREEICNNNKLSPISTIYINWIQEFELLCEPASATLVQSMFFIGTLIGVGFGNASDTYGRKPIILLFEGVNILGLILIYIAPTLRYIYIGSVCIGIYYSANMAPTFSLAKENVASHRGRTISLILLTALEINFLLMSGLMFQELNWRFYMLMAILVRSAYMCMFYIFIPESPLLLVSKGDLGRAGEVVRWMDRVNHGVKGQSEGEILIEGGPSSTALGSSGIFYLYQNVKLRRTSILLSIYGFLIMALYQGIGLFFTQFPGDKYINGAIMGIAGVSAVLLGGMLGILFGGRKIAILLLLLTGIDFYLFSMISNDNPYIIPILLLLGKFSITGAGSIMITYITNYYSVQIRAGALSLFTAYGRLSTLLLPTLFMYVHPEIVFMLFGLLASFVLFLIRDPTHKSNKEL